MLPIVETARRTTVGLPMSFLIFGQHCCVLTGHCVGELLPLLIFIGFVWFSCPGELQALMMPTDHDVVFRLNLTDTDATPMSLAIDFTVDLLLLMMHFLIGCARLCLFFVASITYAYAKTATVVFVGNFEQLYDFPFSTELCPLLR